MGIKCIYILLQLDNKGMSCYQSEAVHFVVVSGFSFSDWRTNFSLIPSPGLKSRLMHMQLCDNRYWGLLLKQTVNGEEKTNKTPGNNHNNRELKKRVKEDA